MHIRYISIVSIVACLTAGFAVEHAKAQAPTPQSVTKDTGGGPTRNFGEVKQLAISSDAALEISHNSLGITRIELAPAVDYFVMRNFAVGGFIHFYYTHADHSSGTQFAIGPRVSYNFALSNIISIWPKVGLSYTHTGTGYNVSAANNTTITTSKSNDALTLNIFVPFMAIPVPHFFAGFGPFLDTDLSGSNKTTSYGLRLTLGGWLD